MTLLSLISAFINFVSMEARFVVACFKQVCPVIDQGVSFVPRSLVLKSRLQHPCQHKEALVSVKENFNAILCCLVSIRDVGQVGDRELGMVLWSVCYILKFIGLKDVKSVMLL